MSECRIGEASGWWSPVVLSFVAGATSASFLWYASGRFVSETDRGDESLARLRQWWLRDIQSRIGELPSLRRRTHWPWDRSKPLGSNDSTPSSPTNQSDRISGNSSEPGTSPDEKKSGLCIGSIFGLDVGGTLAKLVYFERKGEPTDGRRRERHYRDSASAQAVLQARRGLMDDSVLPSTTSSSRPRSHSVNISWTPPRHFQRHRSSETSALPKQHSRDSDEDVLALLAVRQESLPDDLDMYAQTVHMKRSTFKTVDESSSTPLNNVTGGMKKSRSLLEFNRDHAEALDRFYHFARRLDSYREGVKDHELSFYSRELGGEFHFIRFETRRMQNAMDLIRTNNLHLNICEMGATGGGAHKFAQQWADELGIEMKKQDELDSLVAGMQFVLSTVVGECYTFRPHDVAASTIPSSRVSSMASMASNGASDAAPLSAEADDNVGAPLLDEDSEHNGGASDNGESNVEDRGQGDEWWWSRKVQRDAISYSSTYPYLLVTIGTGVSILRVDGPRKHERISGSTIGGGTYWGLIRLLTELEDFEDVMRLAERGDPSKVDMMVGDIYGENSDALEKIGLPSNLVASSFGKLVAMEDPAKGLKEEDLARALLLMVTNNIGQVAYLNAKLQNTPRIYFVGNFLRQNKISQRRLSFAIDYWSKGEMEALFLEHEGYFGALGAFLLSQGVPLDTRETPVEDDDNDSKNSSNSAQTFHKRSHTMGSLQI